MLSPGQRWAVAGGIAGAHFVAISLLLMSGTLTAIHEDAVPFEVSLRELPAHRISRPSPSQAAPRRGAVPKSGAADRAPEAAASAITPPAREWGPMDWESAAGIAAADVLRDLVKGEMRHCDDSPERDPWLPPCRKHYGRFEWSAQPQRAGFDNGIPYLRLGRQCILSLGMFGCALGAPRTNDKLFVDLRDPDRDRSSVADVGDINQPVDAAPQLRSVVLKP